MVPQSWCKFAAINGAAIVGKSQHAKLVAHKATFGRQRCDLSHDNRCKNHTAIGVQLVSKGLANASWVLPRFWNSGQNRPIPECPVNVSFKPNFEQNVVHLWWENSLTSHNSSLWATASRHSSPVLSMDSVHWISEEFRSLIRLRKQFLLRTL